MSFGDESCGEFVCVDFHKAVVADVSSGVWVFDGADACAHVSSAVSGEVVKYRKFVAVWLVVDCFLTGRLVLCNDWWCFWIIKRIDEFFEQLFFCGV